MSTTEMEMFKKWLITNGHPEIGSNTIMMISEFVERGYLYLQFIDAQNGGVCNA